MINQTKRPKIGIGVMIIKNKRILIGRRGKASSHASGTWSFPGGHLETGESFKSCALREIKEECGVKVKNVRFKCVANIKKYGNHHILIGLVADWKSGEPKNLEPEKTANWQWFPINKLPKPLFEGSRLLTLGYKTRKNYFDF